MYLITVGSRDQAVRSLHSNVISRRNGRPVPLPADPAAILGLGVNCSPKIVSRDRALGPQKTCLWVHELGNGFVVAVVSRY